MTGDGEHGIDKHGYCFATHPHMPYSWMVETSST